MHANDMQAGIVMYVNSSVKKTVKRDVNNRVSHVHLSE